MSDRRIPGWRDVRVALGLTPAIVRRARVQLLVFAPLFAGVILIWEYRIQIFGSSACTYKCAHAVTPGATTLQVFVVIALVLLGWQLARDFGRAFSPFL